MHDQRQLPAADAAARAAGQLVLVVEDEAEIADVLEAYLRRDGFRTERARDGEAALGAARVARPDLVLLDVQMPGLNGLEVLKRLRRDSNTPVILVTARVEGADKLIGLELGADDYVTKPFSPREVVARVRAVLRRAAAGRDATAPARFGAIEVDEARALAVANGATLDLTPAEFRLLACLVRRAGRVATRAELLEAALPDSDALERVVDAHMKNLRRKLESAGAVAALETVRGVGYRLHDGA